MGANGTSDNFVQEESIFCLFVYLSAVELELKNKISLCVIIIKKADQRPMFTCETEAGNGEQAGNGEEDAQTTINCPDSRSLFDLRKQHEYCAHLKD